MITGILAFVFMIAAIAAWDNGQYGSAAIGLVIIVLLIALGSASRQGDRAVNNFVDYWAEGGPDRDRR